MGGMSRLALGTTITVSLILALILALFLLLLAHFLSSLLKTPNQSITQNHNLDLESPKNPTKPKPPPLKTPPLLPSFYAHGVLQAPPTSFLLTVPNLEAGAAAASQPVNLISNPVYFDGVQINGDIDNNGTPFETPGTSPSHFGDGGEWSPPLGFMKKLPPVRQWNHGSVYEMTTDTNLASSSRSFSSSTLCFSPSW